MARVTQPTEYPGSYKEKFNAIKQNMMESSKIKGKYSEEEIDVMIKYSLIEEAKDKIEFSLNGQIRRAAYVKKQMTEDEFKKAWRKNMKKRLESDGFPFELTDREIEVFDSIKQKKDKEKAEELAKMTGEAMKQLLSSIE